MNSLAIDQIINWSVKYQTRRIVFFEFLKFPIKFFYIYVIVVFRIIFIHQHATFVFQYLNFSIVLFLFMFGRRRWLFCNISIIILGYFQKNMHWILFFCCRIKFMFLVRANRFISKRILAYTHEVCWLFFRLILWTHNSATAQQW